MITVAGVCVPFDFNKKAEKALKTYVKNKRKWSWEEHTAILKGAGFRHVKTNGSQHVFACSGERMNLDKRDLQFLAKCGYLTLHPHKPHKADSMMPSIAIEKAIEALIVINYKLPQKEKRNDLLSEELLSSSALERFGQNIQR